MPTALAVGLILCGLVSVLAATPMPTSASKNNVLAPTPSETATGDSPSLDASTPDPVTVIRNPQPIPFNATPFFAANRVGNPDVKLPPMPTSLYPVPPAERQPSPIVLPTPKLPDFTPARLSIKNTNSKTPTTATNSGPHAVAGTSTTPEENIAVSPFINWINTTPNAADVARQSQEGYSVNGVATGEKNALNSGDVFFNIRFPYVGNEAPAAGTSAAIYSTPQR